jgi:hypothetical protein
MLLVVWMLLLRKRIWSYLLTMLILMRVRVLVPT